MPFEPKGLDSKKGMASRRSTEGSRKGRPGRPRGTKNKPKGLIGRELATKLMEHMQDQLSPEQFDYIKGVVANGDPIDTKKEIDTLISLMGRGLIPALIQEMMPVEEGGLGGLFRKDVTERIKSVNSLLTLRNNIDKRESPDDDNKQDTILKITSQRGLDLGRLGILVTTGADRVGGNPNGNRREADTIRAIPDKLPERPLLISGGEQGETDRVLDGSLDRDTTFVGFED